MSVEKDYAKSVLEGYSETLSRLVQRYGSAVSAIDAEHNAIKSEINKKAQRDKNMADMSGKVSLRNAQRRLVDSGLSRSGESVQAELDHNLARNMAFSQIEETAARERANNETARAKSKASAFAELIGAMNSAEMKKNEAYIAQLNADRAYAADRDDEQHRRYVENRAYEADRDDEKHDRYVENRAYEADRDDEKHDRYVENRAYEADRDDEKHDRYVENRAYEADRDDEKHDRYVDSRDYKADRDDEQYDRYADSRDFMAEREDEQYDRYADSRDYAADREDELHDRKEGTTVSDTSGSNEDEGITPKLAPRSFVDKIKQVYNSRNYSSYSQRDAAIKKAIDKIIEDETLSYDYRYQVQIYAESIGIY